jgi:C-terminal processing protease CtpA/Prc
MRIRSLLLLPVLALPSGLAAQALGYPGDAPQVLLGVGISCERCTLAYPEYRFEQPPVITTVAEGSIAARSGILPGDTVISVEGESITTDAGAGHFAARVPGRSQKWVVGRAGKRVTLTIAIPKDA